MSQMKKQKLKPSVLDSFHVQPVSSHLKVHCKTIIKMNIDDYCHFVVKEFQVLRKLIDYPLNDY